MKPHDVPVHADFDHLAEVVSVRFSCCKVTPFSLRPYCALWKEVSVCSSHLRTGDLALLMRTEYLHKLFGVLLHGSVSSFFPYSSICLISNFRGLTDVRAVSGALAQFSLTDCAVHTAPALTTGRFSVDSCAL